MNVDGGLWKVVKKQLRVQEFDASCGWVIVVTVSFEAVHDTLWR